MTQFTNKLEAMILIPQDKANHVIYGAFVALAVTWFVQMVLHKGYSHDIGFAAAVVIGALKECSDWIGNRFEKNAGAPLTHDVDFFDFAATSLGGFVIFLATAL